MRRTAVAVLLSVFLVAAACGGGSNGGGATGDDPAEVADAPDVTMAVEGPPRSGGRLIVGTSSDSDGWDPTRNRWAADGTTVAMTFYDPLAAFDENGDWAPYLAESIEPNDDFTVWTIRLRPEITFHDGEPLDSSAVKRTFDGHLESALTRPAFSRVDRVETPDARTAVVYLNAPWAAMPVGLTGQAGMIAAPAQLDDPDTSSLRPVGTGPFRFVEWLPDSRLVVERNPDYWRVDEDGTPLPYLDAIEFRPMPDDDSRLASIRSDDIDLTWTGSTSAVIRYRELATEGRVQLVEHRGQTEVAYIMLNHAKPPFDNPHARLAVAHATNRDVWVDVLGQGQVEPATTLFRPGSPWHSDVDFPEYDLDEARKAVAAYEAEQGPLEFNLSALSTPIAKAQAELLERMWEEAGIRVDIVQTDGATYILDSVLGDFEAVIWAQHGSPDPDYEHVWWDGDNARPLGELSLNFPRHRDEEVDRALEQARSTDDFDARKQAYETVQERFAEQLPYIWLSYVRPVVVAQNDVRGLTNGPLPDRTPSRPLGGPGSFSLANRLVQVWLTG
jgi:peptide/nickel transport system substrate-binding protein